MCAAFNLALAIAVTLHISSVFASHNGYSNANSKSDDLATQACIRLCSSSSSSTNLDQFAKGCLDYRSGEGFGAGAPVFNVQRRNFPASQPQSASRRHVPRGLSPGNPHASDSQPQSASQPHVPPGLPPDHPPHASDSQPQSASQPHVPPGLPPHASDSQPQTVSQPIVPPGHPPGHQPHAPLDPPPEADVKPVNPPGPDLSYAQYFAKLHPNVRPLDQPPWWWKKDDESGPSKEPATPPESQGT